MKTDITETGRFHSPVNMNGISKLCIALGVSIFLVGCSGYQITASGAYTSAKTGFSYTVEWQGGKWVTCATSPDGQKFCIGAAPTQSEAMKIADQHEAKQK